MCSPKEEVCLELSDISQNLAQRVNILDTVISDL